MKRFTETTKWGKEWFQDLAPRLKCFWLFICDHADAAGVWEPNYRLASFQIGEQVTFDDLFSFGDRVRVLEGGKVAILSFIQFQYGTLSEECKAHIPVFRALEKHSLSKGYPKAIHSLKEKEKEKDMDKEKEEGSAEGRLRPDEQAVVETWNASGIGAVRLPLSSTRRKALKARMTEPAWRKDCGAAINRIAASDFCRGSNDKGWKATFDWFLQPDSLAKALEGKYDNRKPNGSTPAIDRGTYALTADEQPRSFNPLTDPDPE